MKNGIILNFPPEIGSDVKEHFIESVNQKLEPIQKEVNNWNGFIDLKKVNDDDYECVAICDNDSLREQMQLLLAG